MFTSPIGPAEGRICSSCGKDPSLSTPSAIPVSPLAAPAADPRSATRRQASAMAKAQKVRSKKTRSLIVKFTVSWLIFLAVLVLLAKQFGGRDGSQEDRDRLASTPDHFIDGREILHHQTATETHKVFQNFLATAAIENTSEFVLNPVATASKMARFYQLNPSTRIEAKGIKPINSSMLLLPNRENAYYASWRTEDGRVVDTVFRKQDGTWRLDWEHYVRYSVYPWFIFLAGDGPDEGEFRLLARERLLDESKENPNLSVVFYQPRFGSPDDPGPPSSEFNLPRHEVDGKLLSAAFQRLRAGEQVFGSTAELPDPQGLIRVRVKVRRVEESGVKRFELVKVIACHWLELDDTGIPEDALTEPN